MPVVVYWDDEAQTIVRYDFKDKWTWDELYRIYYQAIAMETSVTHRVDVILDFRESGFVPANALMHMKNISDKQPPNIGLSVFVTTNRFIGAMFQTGVRFYPKIAYYFRLAGSMDEARTIIAEAIAQGIPEIKSLVKKTPAL